MALEATPASVATDGNLRITFVDDASQPAVRRGAVRG
jgi:hypothetical protein